MAKFMLGQKKNGDIYRDRLEYHRSLLRPVGSVFRHLWSGELTLKQKIRKIYLEFALVYNALKSIRDEVQTFGVVIRQNYGISKTMQFFRQCKLYFRIGVPWQHKLYRKYLMFDPVRWNKAREFTYFNEPLERDFIVSNTPGATVYSDEMDLLRDKVRFHSHCVENKLPTPAIYSVFEVENGRVIDCDNISLPEEDLFFKRIDGACGVGAKRVSYADGNYRDKAGNRFNRSDLSGILSMENKGSATYIVQPVIRNHPLWQKFTSGALATCRILTARQPKSEMVIPLSAVLRLPSGSAIADNFSQGALVSPVDLKTGVLGKALCFEPKNGRFETDSHPDTGQNITGSKLPEWEALVDFTKEVHKTIDMAFVGWDISFTEQGFMVVEGNGMWGADILECAHNQPLVDTMYGALYNEWYGNTNSNGKESYRKLEGLLTEKQLEDYTRVKLL